jgi:4'-phosphopantetheinyl transferase
VPFPGADEIHLWRVQLSHEAERPWRDLLTDDERQRAERFRFAADRQRFTVTRAVLRTLLGRYVGAAPSLLRLECNEFGKPFLAENQNPEGIRFNVAHSGSLSLLAFGQGMPLGVDVEQVRGDRNVDELARAVFSPPQRAAWLALPGEARSISFFEAWTRREAVAKALGGGLSLLPGGVEVQRAGDAEWAVSNIAAGEGYAAALAVRARRRTLWLWDWRHEEIGKSARIRTPLRR